MRVRLPDGTIVRPEDLELEVVDDLNDDLDEDKLEIERREHPEWFPF